MSRRQAWARRRLVDVTDKPIRQDLLDELARLFADEVREILSQRAAPPTRPQEADKRPANSRKEGR